jgi:cysteine desulfurase/selenocysteine lyase
MSNQVVDEIRSDFPALQMEVYGKPLVFLDSAASSLKPRPVIEAIASYYQSYNSNVHRGAYRMSQLASDAYDGTREKIRQYLNAESDREIIFTKGTTESINLVAHGLQGSIGSGDEILLTQMEHHANIIPWQRLCRETGATLKVVPVNEDGTLKFELLRQLIGERTALVGLTHISNVLGTINPVREIVELAHRYGAKVLVDGAQGIVHGPVDVRDMDCDFYCFSGHKFYGPMGIGVLYGKAVLLENMEPYQLGGAMIDRVSFENTTFKGIPAKFEAGTPNVSGVIGLGKATEYILGIGWETIRSIETGILRYAEKQLREIVGLHIVGQSPEKASICSFVVDGIHSYDIGTLIDKFGVACRTGNHCTQPLHDALGLSGTVRASFAFFNTEAEVDVFVKALKQTIQMLR